MQTSGEALLYGPIKNTAFVSEKHKQKYVGHGMEAEKLKTVVFNNQKTKLKKDVVRTTEIGANADNEFAKVLPKNINSNLHGMQMEDVRKKDLIFQLIP